MKPATSATSFTAPQPESGLETRGPGSSACLSVRGVSKRFNVFTSPTSRLSSFLVHQLATRWRRSEVWALRDVSVEVNRGEIVGIAGVNGSGKSTLLKIMSGISHATSGTVVRPPRVAAILDLSTGFHPNLTGYENLFLCASIIGMERDQLRRRLPQIIEFSGIEARFLESKIRHYSSGMVARLGFALAVHTDPDAVLVDEVLAVGDLEFQTRSAERLLNYRDQGKAMVLVSHMVGTLEQLCDRIIWLHEGKVRLEGKPEEVGVKYRAFLNTRIAEAEHHTLPEAAATGSGEIRSVHFTSNEGDESVETLHDATLTADISAFAPVNEWDLFVKFVHETGAVVDEFTASERGVKLPAFDHRSVRVEIRLPHVPLSAGRYEVQIEAFTGAADRREIVASAKTGFTVTTPYFTWQGYIYEPECTFELKRLSADETDVNT